MTTPRDLLIVAVDMESGHPVERGDLSLALAGAELIDLLGTRAVRLDGDRIVPGSRPEIADPLLDQAASSLVWQAPYESVGDWLWRRGRGLAAAYLAALEADSRLTRRRRRLLPFTAGRTVLADSPDRRRAEVRWASHEPVLAALATAAGIDGAPARDATDLADEATVTVLASVDEAVTELAAVRQRRAVEQAAFDNVWRGYGD